MGPVGAGKFHVEDSRLLRRKPRAKRLVPHPSPQRCLQRGHDEEPAHGQVHWATFHVEQCVPVSRQTTVSRAASLADRARPTPRREPLRGRSTWRMFHVEHRIAEVSPNRSPNESCSAALVSCDRLTREKTRRACVCSTRNAQNSTSLATGQEASSVETTPGSEAGCTTVPQLSLRTTHHRPLTTHWCSTWNTENAATGLTADAKSTKDSSGTTKKTKDLPQATS